MSYKKGLILYLIAADVLTASGTGFVNANLVVTVNVIDHIVLQPLARIGIQ